MNNKWHLCKNVITTIPDELKKNQSQYFHLALCIQFWKIWTFSNTFRLKKKRGSLVWPKLQSTQKIEGTLKSHTFVAVHPARGPGDWIQSCCFTGNSYKRRLRLKLQWPAWIAWTPQPPRRSMSKRCVAAPGWGTAELWGPKKSHSHPSFSECKSTQKIFIYPGLKVGCKNDSLNELLLAMELPYIPDLRGRLNLNLCSSSYWRESKSLMTLPSVWSKATLTLELPNLLKSQFLICSVGTGFLLR